MFFLCCNTGGAVVGRGAKGTRWRDTGFLVTTLMGFFTPLVVVFWKDEAETVDLAMTGFDTGEGSGSGVETMFENGTFEVMA